MHELDDKLTDEDLDGIINEVDEDGSGTIDFDGNIPPDCSEWTIYTMNNTAISHRIHRNDDWLSAGRITIRDCVLLSRIKKSSSLFGPKRVRHLHLYHYQTIKKGNIQTTQMKTKQDSNFVGCLVVL